MKKAFLVSFIVILSLILVLPMFCAAADLNVADLKYEVINALEVEGSNLKSCLATSHDEKFIYFTDYQGQSITKIDAKTLEVEDSICLLDDTDLSAYRPLGVDTDDRGNVYVIVTQFDKPVDVFVFIYNKNLEKIGECKIAYDGATLNRLTGLDVFKTDDNKYILYVTSRQKTSNTAVVYAFDVTTVKNGCGLLTSFGKDGVLTVALDTAFPNQIVVEDQNTFYITSDRTLHKVVVDGNNATVTKATTAVFNSQFTVKGDYIFAPNSINSSIGTTGGFVILKKADLSVVAQLSLPADSATKGQDLSGSCVIGNTLYLSTANYDVDGLKHRALAIYDLTKAGIEFPVEENPGVEDPGEAPDTADAFGIGVVAVVSSAVAFVALKKKKQY